MAGGFAQALGAAWRLRSDRPVVVGDGFEVGWAELDGRASALASRLAERGLGPGHRVALAIGNRWPFAVALLAGWKAGAVVAPLVMRLTDDERRAVLADLRPALVLDEANVLDEADVLDEAACARAPLDAGPAGDEAALVLYTSGSTGRPKGAVLSHDALAFGNTSWAGPVMGLGEDDSVLAALPFAHSFGLNGALLAPLLAGARVALLDRFTPEAALEAIERHRVTVLPGVATMFRRILDCPALGSADLTSLRLAVSGAAPCPWTLAEEWRARTGTRIVRGYGMTELFRPISYRADDPHEVPDAVGRAMPGVELRVVGDDGVILAPGEPGELWIRTPGVMQGYLDAHEDTRDVLTDGWFRTGDLASVSSEGDVHIVGRKRERILRGGHSVFPAEVEAVLLAHPAVAEAAVVGLPHADLGEDVAAFVVLRPGGRAGDLDAWCRARLASFKSPRQIRVLDALPRSATGKILTSKLRLPDAGAGPGDSP